MVPLFRTLRVVHYHLRHRTAPPSLMDPLPRLRRGVLEFLMVQQFPKDLQYLMHRVIHFHRLFHLDRQLLKGPLFRWLHLDLLFRLVRVIRKVQHLHLYPQFPKDLRHRKVRPHHLFPANLGYLMVRQFHLAPLFRLHLLILKHRVILMDRRHLMVPHLR